LFDAIGKLLNNGIGPKSIEILTKAGCFDCFLEKEQSRKYILDNLEEIFKSCRLMKSDGEFIITPRLTEYTEPSVEEKVALESEQFNLLGVSFAIHPIAKIKQQYQGKETIISLNDSFVNESGYSDCIVIITSFREIKTKTGLPMAFLKVEDETKVCDVVIFPGAYTKYKSIIEKNKVYLINLKYSPRGLQVNTIKPL
ncbi:MAG: hypothetical protein K2M43_00355, partial [Mycoplasmoidaceae bacterium]|nr:hypothetical protein [Mycoplasmoidaceae bacterium]